MRRILGWIGGRAFEAWAKPLRDRIAELEEDNQQLHLALAADVMREEERIKQAAPASAGQGQEGMEPESVPLPSPTSPEGGRRS